MGLPIPSCNLKIPIPQFKLDDYPKIPIPKWALDCGILGCDTDIFAMFGNCPGIEGSIGILGIDGYCLIPGGCKDPCPPNVSDFWMRMT
jgi:hypothetical protein